MDRDKSVTREKVNIDSLLSCLHDSETGDPHLQVIGFAMMLTFRTVEYRNYLKKRKEQTRLTKRFAI